MRTYLLLGILPFLCFGLSGCNEDQVLTEVTRYRVVDVPPALYTGCPAVGSIPKSNTLTDEQVAHFIIKLYKNNIKCRQSLMAIHNFLNDAHKTIDGQPVVLHPVP